MAVLLSICALLAPALGWDSGRTLIHLSYFDMASDALHFGPRSLVDLYWSPLYPALLAGWLGVFRPSPAAELPCVIFLNWLIFVLCFLSFWFFCSSWQRALRPPGGADSDDRSFHKTIAYLGIGVFFWCVTSFVGINWVTPDLCVAAIVFLAAGVCCRLSPAPAGWRMYGFLGAVLGLGYYAKAAMFPAALLLLSCLLAFPPSTPPNRRGIALAAGVFLLTATPLIALMSRRAGHPTIGEAGRLNYAWYVNKVPPFFWMTVWTGGPPGHGAPLHPIRQLSDNPRLVEFESPVGGTFPLFRDPAYWYDGVRASFNLTQQLAVLRGHLTFFLQLAKDVSVLLGGALALCVLTLRTKSRPRPTAPFRWMIAWPIAVFGMYSCVHIEERFVAAFIVLLGLAVFGVLLCRVDPEAGRVAAITVACSLLLQVALLYSYGAGKRVWHEVIGHGQQPWYLAVAEQLRQIGIHPGDRLALVGQDPPEYGVRLAGARIVAMFPDADSYWKAGAPDLARAQEQLRKAGIKALLATKSDAIGADAAGWTAISDSGYMVRLLDAP
jgi:hypothetical protein